MLMVFWLLMCFIFGSLCSNLAKQKNRSSTIWFVVGFLTGIFGVMAIFILPVRKVLPETKLATVGAKEWGSVEEKEKDNTPMIRYTLEKSRWYWLDSQHVQQNEISFVELKEMWKENKLGKETFIWQKGMKEWKKIKDTKLLLELLENSAAS